MGKYGVNMITWSFLPIALIVILNLSIVFYFCLKSKETYYARCQELDKFKKDGSSAKEIEKVRSTFYV